MKVRDAMTPNPVTVDPDAPIATAMSVMRAKAIRHLPVVDDAGRLLGIITDRDLRTAAFAPVLAEHLSLRAQRRLAGLGRALEELRVKDAMTWDVVTVHPDATITHAAVIISAGRFGSLPVVEDGVLVGMLTERDLIRVLAELTQHPKLEVDDFLW